MAKMSATSSSTANAAAAAVELCSPLRAPRLGRGDCLFSSIREGAGENGFRRTEAQNPKCPRERKGE